MDYASIKIESMSLGRQLYSTVADKRNAVLLKSGDNPVADAFAIETCSELLALVIGSTVSTAKGQTINEDFQAIYMKFRDAVGKLVEETMLENGMEVLRVDVPGNKEDEHGVG